MDRYLIESPHELKDCVRMLQQVLALGYLYNFDWGCASGTHVGWAIVEAESEAQARMAVPPLVRPHCRIIKLNKFTPEQVTAMHG